MVRWCSRIAAMCVVLVVAACGGGSTQTEPVVVPVVVPVNALEFWIGATGPANGSMNLGPKQYPFVCHTTESNLGQPEIDNTTGRGSAVFPLMVGGTPNYAATPVGYSENCGLKTRVDYFYWDTTAKNFLKLAPGATLPATVQTITVNGTPQPFVVRVETGTLNRFIYTIAMLAPYTESTANPAALNNSAWNKKLVYYFRGGVGIGHWQGAAAWLGGLWSAERAWFPLLLQQGYAIATSSGNTTDVHYNLRLAEEVMAMVKEHFTLTYGKPTYTVGLGASGGAIQQYVIGQNRLGLLDAGIPVQSYPDMVTQAIHIGDCNPLEQYFLEDYTIKGAASKWATWSNRQWIQGLNTVDVFSRPSAFRNLLPSPGFSECIRGWVAAVPLVLNPKFHNPQLTTALERYKFPAADIAAIKWTHWNDLENIYGVDSNGFAPIPFDNVGVQYGLQALLNGNITPIEFIEINACMGSWKEQKDLVQWDMGAANGPFDATNMNRDAAKCRAPFDAGWAASARRSGDIGAMNKGYTSGHVFTGNINIPLIDLRPYLEPQLDMHNVRQSFSARQRLINKRGNADNQVIWFTGSEADIPARIVDALGVLDSYLTSGVKPVGFVDKCNDAAGTLIALGTKVWDGILNNRLRGACTIIYPIKSSSRMVAGDSIAGDMFKCALKPVAAALIDGTYGMATSAFAGNALAQLNAIFPAGVCEYSLPDQGKPAGF